MIDSSVARRYARALLSLALEAESGAARSNGTAPAERFAAQLASVSAALESSSDARAALLDPGYSAPQRQSVVETLSQQLKLDPVLTNFLRLLVQRQRIGALPLIVRAYGEMLDVRLGRVRAVVTSAQPLSAQELAAMKEALSRASQRTIILEARTDPALVGGVVAQVGGTVFDGSVRTQLQRLRAELKQGPI